MTLTDERRSELLGLVNGADCLAHLLAQPHDEADEPLLREIVLGHNSAADRVCALEAAGLV